MDIEATNWMALQKCPICEHLWCDVPHEPYASFDFWTAWPFSEEEWKRLIRIDQGLILHEWHDAIIREDFRLLPRREFDAVEGWRNRTYRHYNPIDRGPDVQKPRYCETSEDISRYINHD